MFSTCFASRSSSAGSLFIVSIVVLFLLHVTVTCAGRHMELEPSAKQIGWVLRNQNGLSRPSSFWTSSAAKRWCLPWGSRSRHELWAPDWVFLWKVDRGTPYWSWLWDILAFWGTTLIHFHFSFNQNLRFFEMYFLGVELCMLAPSATGRSFRAVGFMNGQRSTEVLPSLSWFDVTWIPRFRSFVEKDELHWNTLRFDISHAAFSEWAAEQRSAGSATQPQNVAQIWVLFPSDWRTLDGLDPSEIL